MKVVIDISKEDFVAIRDCHAKIGEDLFNLERNMALAIRNGTPLPKGHGRLVDENHVIAELVYRKDLLADNVTCGQVTEIFNRAVVVGADRESNNEIDN